MREMRPHQGKADHGSIQAEEYLRANDLRFANLNAAATGWALLTTSGPLGMPSRNGIRGRFLLPVRRAQPELGGSPGLFSAAANSR